MKTSLMPRLLSIPMATLALLWAGTAQADDAAAMSATQASGQRVYETWCAACHGPGPGRYGRGLTGTEALEARYEGKVPPVLDERTDLTPEFVAVFVRRGLSVMPFFRRTEISDAELAALGAYLSRRNPALPAPVVSRP
jgi:mono/diheme cytochrome c family protein